MKVTPVAGFKSRMPVFLELAKREPVFITRNGRIAAVLEAITEDEVEDYLLERNPKFRALLKRAAEKPGTMSLESYRKSRRR